MKSADGRPFLDLTEELFRSETRRTARLGEQEAKADIAECDRSKVQLESDVCLLFDLLVRARKERRLFVGAVGRLEQTVASSDAKNVEVCAASSASLYVPPRAKTLEHWCMLRTVQRSYDRSFLNVSRLYAYERKQKHILYIRAAHDNSATKPVSRTRHSTHVH